MEYNTLIDIYSDLKAGDLVLFQLKDQNDILHKPQMAVIVGIDIWDMAVAVYYTKYKSFDSFNYDKHPEVIGFGEWMEFWQILGHWHSMPTFSELKASYRKSK